MAEKASQARGTRFVYPLKERRLGSVYLFKDFNLRAVPKGRPGARQPKLGRAPDAMEEWFCRLSRVLGDRFLQINSALFSLNTRWAAWDGTARAFVACSIDRFQELWRAVSALQMLYPVLPNGFGFQDLTFPFVRKFPVRGTSNPSDLEKEITLDNGIHPFIGKVKIYSDIQKTVDGRYFSYGFVVNYSVDLVARPLGKGLGVSSSSSAYPTPSSSDPIRL